MILAKVTRRVVSNAKLETLPARPLLEAIPLPGYGDSTPLVVIDTVQAGPGDTILVMQEGTGARQAALPDPANPMPAQMVAIGVVDQVDFGDRPLGE